MSQAEHAAVTIRRKLDNHSAKNALGRLINKVSGKYPTEEERHILHRHEIGAAGRFKEDVYEGVEWTNRLGGLFDQAEPYTHAVELSDEPEMKAAVKALLALDKQKVAAIDAVVFGVHDYSKYKQTSKLVSEADIITMYVVRHGKDIAKVNISHKMMHVIKPELQEGLEQLGRQAANESFMQYVGSQDVAAPSGQLGPVYS